MGGERAVWLAVATQAPAHFFGRHGSFASATLVALESTHAVRGCGNRNIVSTVDLKTSLDLKKIALHARNAEYNPKVSVARE